MASPSEWSFLAPWCLALGPYLSVEACLTETNACDGFVFQVGDYLGPTRRQYPQREAAPRLVLMREALELISLALSTSNPSSRNALLNLCQNEDLNKQLDQFPSNAFTPRFLLAFRAGSHGDCHDALEILQDLVAKAWRSETTDEYKAARTAILGRRGVEVTVAQAHRVHISFRLQPPVKDTSDFMTAYLTAPSRADTIVYYEALYQTLKTISAMDSTHGPTVDGLELDLAHLETPAHMIRRVDDILALGLPIRRLALQLSYSWDVFDQATLVRVLNSPATARIGHVVLAATTGDNLEAAFDSLPLLTNVHHVELVDRVLFGYAAPSFMAACRRVLLSSKQWQPQKLTLRGGHFHDLPLETTFTTGSCGLDALAVHLSGRDVDSFLRVLPRFGSQLSSLEIHVVQQPTSSIRLASIASSCHRLRAIEIHGAVVDGLEVVPRLMEQKHIAWTSVMLQNVEIADSTALHQLAHALADPSSTTARTITKLALVQSATLCADATHDFQRALSSNTRLEYIELGPVDASARAALAGFDGALLTDCKYAFLSVLHPSTSSQASCGPASASIDTWNLAHIMDLAGLTRHRRVVLS